MNIIDQYGDMISEVSALKQIEESKLTTPIQEDGWSIREIIAHLYGWDSCNLKQMVRNMAHGADLPAFPDHDAQNAKSIKTLQGRTVYEIIDLFVNKRQEIVDALNKVEPKTRFTIGGGKRVYSPEAFTTIFMKHDAHHMEQIRLFLR